MKTGMFLIVCCWIVCFAFSLGKDEMTYSEKDEIQLKEILPRNEHSDSSQKITPLIKADTTNIQKIAIGTILPDLEDSTILTFLYGSCYSTEEGYTYNNGVQIWDSEDSIYMQVKERLGNDTLQIIYVRGEMAYTSVMHNFYNEAAIIARKVENGWKVINGYKDSQVIDFNSVELAGIYFDRFLLRYEIFGVYAGGVEYGSVSYTLMEPGSFDGQFVDFMLSSSNTASSQCFADTDVEDYHCDCYSRSGKDTFYFDAKFNALVFDYEYNDLSGDCEMKDSISTTAKQKWYMNANNSFLANGNHLSDWGENILEEVNLKEEEIRKKLLSKD